MNQLARINTLFNKDHLEELKSIQKIGVIAGGAVTYAMCDFVPKGSVGDVDLFVGTVEDAEKVAEIFGSKLSDPVDRGYNIKIWTVPVADETMTVQVIQYADAIEGLTAKERALNVVGHFDIDAVQCAIHDDNLYTTDRCLAAHQNRTVNQFRLNWGLHSRLRKMMNKGFNTPCIATCDQERKYTFGCYSDWIHTQEIYIKKCGDRNFLVSGLAEYDIFTAQTLEDSPETHLIRLPVQTSA